MQKLFENWRRFLKEDVGAIGYHITNENNREGIEEHGIRGSEDSIDGLRTEAGEKRVYFFKSFETARLAMFEEGNIIGNPEPPYILIEFDVPGEAVHDPELKDHDIYGPNAYYVVGSVPGSAIKNIKHEKEIIADEEEDDDYYL
jgi:hypothetical protein